MQNARLCAALPERARQSCVVCVCMCTLKWAFVFFLYNRNNCVADIFDLAPWLLIEHNHLYRIMCITGKGQEQVISNYNNMLGVTTDGLHLTQNWRKSALLWSHGTK